MTQKVDTALRRFDEENGKDPRSVEFEGARIPRELLHSTKMHEWILKLEPGASLELRLAARCNALRRWEIPRDTYPRTTAGYHGWRRALRKFHADAAEKILRDVGFDDAVIGRVRDLVLMKNFPQDRETQLMEDADCLTFLETKFDEYLGAWDEPKTVRILKGTIGKMSPAARTIALNLPLAPAARALMQKALV